MPGVKTCNRNFTAPPLARVPGWNGTSCEIINQTINYF